MNKKITGYFCKNRPNTAKNRFVLGDLEVTIVSTLPDGLSRDQVCFIIRIIQYEVRNLNDATAYNIASRICLEDISHEIVTALVSGKENGHKWTVKLSYDPSEFID